MHAAPSRVLQVVVLAAVACGLLSPARLAAASQAAGSSEFVETGKVSLDGHETYYRIRNLPVSSFPDLPAAVAAALTERNCLIPQTYEARRPENVIHGSLEKPGSSDWAVLCLAHGQVSLLVFFSGTSDPAVLASAPVTQRLQIHDLTGELGFNWGIDPARPQRVHDAQAGMTHRPPTPDHDAIADSILDRKTIFHLYRNGAWETVDLE